MRNTTFFIWIDSDGVLADFDEKIREITGKECHELPKGTLWQHVDRYNQTNPFFESLAKMPGADRLVQFVRANFEHHGVLTACGNTPKDAREQKIIWYHRMWPGLRCEVVLKSPDKAANFAAPNAVLIDDRAKSIDPWVAAGGIGILHTSVDDTIRQLQELLSRVEQEDAQVPA